MKKALVVVCETGVIGKTHATEVEQEVDCEVFPRRMEEKLQAGIRQRDSTQVPRTQGSASS